MAWRDIDPALGLVPAISLEFGFICRVNFGREPFRFAPPTSSVLPVDKAVQERLASLVRASAGKHAGEWWPTTGETNVDTHRLVAEALFTHKAPRGFSCASVKYHGMLLMHGKWYFEMTFKPSW